MHRRLLSHVAMITFMGTISIVCKLQTDAFPMEKYSHWFIRSNFQQANRSCFDEIVGEKIWSSGLKLLRRLQPQHPSHSPTLVSITESSGCSHIPWSEEGFQVLSLKISPNDAHEVHTCNVKKSGIRKLVSKSSEIVQHMKTCNVPSSFDILKLDLFDCNHEVAATILAEGFKPSIILAKVNALFPPPIRYVANCTESSLAADPDFNGVTEQGLGGCSFSHLSDLLRSYGYTAIEVCEQHAVVFIQNDSAMKLYPNVSTSELDIWYRGCAEDMPKTHTDKGERQTDDFSAMVHDFQRDIVSFNLSSRIRISVDQLSKTEKVDELLIEHPDFFDIPDPHSKFRIYRETVCWKCSRRNLECGCNMGVENPAFLVVSDFLQRMHKARDSNYEAPMKWVVVHVMGGVGNQQLQMVTGMMLAIATGRALAFDHSGKNAELDHDFNYDSVFDFPSPDQIPDLRHSSQLQSRDLHFSRETIALFLCENLVEAFEEWDVLRLIYGQSPHVILANPYHGDFLKNAFWDKPFFFLSHFVWMGQRSRQIPVHFNTLPVPQPWDGVRSLDDFISRVRSSNVSKVMGVHSRIYSKRAFEYFDHRYFKGSDSMHHRSYCMGDPGSLEDFEVCLSDLIALRRHVGNLSQNVSESTSTEGPIVILWATDNDDLAESLLQYLQSLSGVHVVRIEHGNSDRFDIVPDTGMVDLAMLEESDILIGTTSSTFSFAAHARGLIRPLYPSFRNNRSVACGGVTGTEAGLLTYGTTHSECQYHPESNEMVCARLEPECLQFVMGGTFIGNCIQEVGQCLRGNISWAVPYILDVEVSSIHSNYFARNFFRFRTEYPFEHFSSCIDDNDISSTKQPTSEPRSRFELFQDVVCTKCSARGVQCGCDLQAENPAFLLLEEFVQRMESARESNYDIPLKWIVVDIMGGLGNQQIEMVMGLLVALASHRGLAIDVTFNKDPVEGRDGHDYFYDSVVHFPIYHMIANSVFLSTARSLHIGGNQVLSFVCADLETAFSDWDFVHLSWGQSPHVIFANPLYESLQRAFWDKPFFFLSHFIWMGREIRQVPARFSTLPAPQAWDGLQSLDDFVRQLKSSNVERIVGLHTRVHTSKPYIYFDHRYFKGSNTMEHTSYCEGHPGSLEDIQECLNYLIQSDGSNHSNLTFSDRSVVILWATDNDELTAGLLQQLQNSRGVHIVKILHEEIDRTDQLPWTGMLDLSMLEEADFLVGTTISTFSYAAHARGLIQPFYPSFRGDRTSQCGKLSGTEGGLLFQGAMYDDCDVTDSKASCSKIRPDCLHLTMGSIFHGDCLQSFDACFAESSSWASPYLTDLDLCAVNTNFLARRSIQFDYDDPIIKACPPVSDKVATENLPTK